MIKKYIYGGWCPNLTGIIKSEKESYCTVCKGINDVGPLEDIDIEVLFTDGYASKITCGIPEAMFVSGNFKWDEGGFFLVEASFSEDFEGEYDIGNTLDDYEKEKLVNLLYGFVKKEHHRHMHHSPEDDSLLSLVSNLDKFELNKDMKRKLANDIYRQYKIDKLQSYIDGTCLIGKSRDVAHLEGVINLLSKGIGECTFGLAFLGIYGGVMFRITQLNFEHIKIESAMRSLDVLKSKYTLQLMKIMAEKNENAEKIISMLSALTHIGLHVTAVGH